MNTLDSLLAGTVSDPCEETRWLVLADFLEENDLGARAELLRLHRKLIATCLEPDAHPDRAGWHARVVELLVAGVRPCVPQETLTLPGGVPMTFSFIPPGAFLMGSEHPDAHVNAKPVHRAELTHGFFLGVYPVTQAQWAAVVGTDPSKFKGAERPVEQVSRDDCEAFCSRLSGLLARTFDLPTEVEWEGACRAGTTTAFHFGDVGTADLATYTGRDNRLNATPDWRHQATTEVGSHPPNAWGLFDMHGNVYEWCAGRCRPYPGSTHDPEGGLVLATARGGCWHSGQESCRSADRLPIHQRVRDYSYCGFRVCLRPS